MPQVTPSVIVPVILGEPARGAIWEGQATRMSGLERMRAALERSLPDPPITVLTGLWVTDVGLRKTTFAMPASPW